MEEWLGRRDCLCENESERVDDSQTCIGSSATSSESEPRSHDSLIHSLSSPLQISDCNASCYGYAQLFQWI